jgi:hypothetical protein
MQASWHHVGHDIAAKQIDIRDCSHMHHSDKDLYTSMLGQDRDTYQTNDPKALKVLLQQEDPSVTPSHSADGIMPSLVF